MDGITKLALAIACGLALSACGGGGGDDGVANSPPGATTSPGGGSNGSSGGSGSGSTNDGGGQNSASPSSYAVSTIAGISHGIGSTDGPAASATFNQPSGVAVGPDGSVYVADTFNLKIRKIANGTVSTVAGTGGLPTSSLSGDGPCASALFASPQGLAVDQTGTIYVADYTIAAIYHAVAVRKIINPGTAACTVSTLASGSVTSPVATNLWAPWALTLDAAGNVYVSDNDSVRKITPAGDITTIAGNTLVPGYADGPGTSALFSDPRGIALGPDGNLYVAEVTYNNIRMITPNGIVTTWAGSSAGLDGPSRPYGLIDGAGTSALFDGPFGLAFGPNGALYVADTGNNAIRRIMLDAQVTTIAGTVIPSVNGYNTGKRGCDDGPANQATFSDPMDVAVDANGAIYVADKSCNAIRKITPQ
ncbi:MAG: hypothetical protein LBU72_06305 [Burkholderiaceae bacterium]|jgi:sugar lactone lactonase YvrE|nr:hypothetical protein [Burkholderiaceae bacterium]